MSARKRTLASVILRHHLWAASLTLGALMLLLLVVADHLAQRFARYDLAMELRAVTTVDTPTPLTPRQRARRARQEQITLNADGSWQHREILARTNKSGTHWSPRRWPVAANVRASGELQGTGTLPWVGGQVVWAARATQAPDGSPRILVAWEHLQSIREEAVLTYGAVIFATTFAFVVSVLLALRISRYATGVIRQVTQSGREMTAGNYDIHLPGQPVTELDELSAVITGLAKDLDQTTVELQAEHHRLARLEVLQRQFVADASHELRAPLAAMSMTLAAWDDGLLSHEEQPDALTQLRREARRLGAMVTQLLDLSRIESGRETLSPAPIDVAKVIQEVAGSFRHQPGAPIILSLPAQRLTVTADRDALYRILHNLVGNARRFTESTGEIHIHAVLEHDTVLFSVRDTGCGISAADLPHIWDRFSRSERARASGETGSGLGLAIVKALVDAMGGCIQAESRVGYGTTIQFTLPAVSVQ